MCFHLISTPSFDCASAPQGFRPIFLYPFALLNKHFISLQTSSMQYEHEKDPWELKPSPAVMSPACVLSSLQKHKKYGANQAFSCKNMILSFLGVSGRPRVKQILEKFFGRFCLREISATVNQNFCKLLSVS